MPGVEVKIVDPETGATVALHTLGEYCTRGYHVMHEYFEMAEATAKTIDNDGWLHTGDLCSMDERGYCKVEGRLKDMIIRGGENIYPREIEEFLFSHPDVSEVQVFGVPDTRLGEEVCAWVVAQKGRDVRPEALRTFCEGQIAHFKVPCHIRIVNELPMTITGKPQKFVMRDRMIDELSSGSPG